ncbi:hypothetical protein KQX54_011702 [Cotesia glomerata]|uniref:Uncharacterized protein n=1 Tax=Cotesia glomerata TaxID=32391 RepID=A0AAV7J7B2_COTGL|nr:hypothetical protein KQX54_011702 [Cotesia glomerata]
MAVLELRYQSPDPVPLTPCIHPTALSNSTPSHSVPPSGGTRSASPSTSSRSGNYPVKPGSSEPKVTESFEDYLNSRIDRLILWASRKGYGSGNSVTPESRLLQLANYHLDYSNPRFSRSGLI